MKILIKINTGSIAYINSELPISCLLGESFLNQRRLLEAQETISGCSVVIKGESYIIGQREYSLFGQYGLKAIATDSGIVPLLRVAKGKERTITQRIVKDRFGQVDVSGPENESWPIIEKIVPVIHVSSELVEEFIETASLEEEILYKEEEEYDDEL